MTSKILVFVLLLTSLGLAQGVAGDPGVGDSGAVASGPVQLATDPCTASNNNMTASGNWTAITGEFDYFGSKCQTASTGTGGQTLYYWSAATSPAFNDNQYAEGKFTAINASWQCEGPGVRIGAASGYWICANTSTALTLYKYNASAAVPLCSTDTVPYTVAVNDVIRLEVSGTTLTVKRTSGTPATLGTCTDSTFSTGKPGLGANGAGNTTLNNINLGNL